MDLKKIGCSLIYSLIMGTVGGLEASASAVTTISTDTVRESKPTSVQLAHADDQFICYRTLKSLDMYSGSTSPQFPGGRVKTVPSNNYVYVANSPNTFTGTLLWYKVAFGTKVGWIAAREGNNWNIRKCTD